MKCGGLFFLALTAMTLLPACTSIPVEQRPDKGVELSLAGKEIAVRILAEPEAVERNLLKIKNRAFSTAILSASLNDFLRIYQSTSRDGIDFHYTAIPAEFDIDGTGAFHTEEMNALFDLGCRMAQEGTA